MLQLQKQKSKQTDVEKELEAGCPACGSKDVYGISRVVGYYSKINNWNVSKIAEFKERQKGKYKLKE